MSELHALIIDDNAKNVHVLIRLLSEHDVTCTAVTNPRLLDGVLVGLSKLDLILVDLEMPGLNGFDVLDKLKSDARYADVPVVACTVHVSEMNAAHQRGFDGFIGKPLDPDRFPDQLERILRHEGVWETA